MWPGDLHPSPGTLTKVDLDRLPVVNAPQQLLDNNCFCGDMFTLAELQRKDRRQVGVSMA